MASEQQKGPGVNSVLNCLIIKAGLTKIHN